MAMLNNQMVIIHESWVEFFTILSSNAWPRPSARPPQETHGNHWLVLALPVFQALKNADNFCYYIQDGAVQPYRHKW